MNTNHRRIKINVSWRWGLFFCLMSVVFSSCIDDFDVKKLQDTPRLVLYCFPTEGDSTLIVVTKSLPVSSFKGDIDTQSRLPVDASVVYKVNGMPQEVKRIENIKEAQSFSHVSDRWFLSTTLIGQYYAVGKQKAGDKIDVQVSADGLSEVSASTSIPEKIDVNIGDIHLQEKSSDHDVYFSVDKLEATFSDPASTTDYYSVKVTLKQKYGNLKGVPKEGNRWQHDVYVNNYQAYLDYLGREDEYEWCFDSLASNIDRPEMVTTSEPLINKKSELDNDFGFDEYKYFDDVYIFNDRTINGQTYTMHLEVRSNDSYWHTYDGWDRLFGFTYNVQLCKVTPEYYRFLKSINDAQSNSWADAGLMQVTPTYSNVKGGFGVVAGFNVCEASKYIAPLPSAPSDNQGGIYTK